MISISENPKSISFDKKASIDLGGDRICRLGAVEFKCNSHDCFTCPYRNQYYKSIGVKSKILTRDEINRILYFTSKRRNNGLYIPDLV